MKCKNCQRKVLSLHGGYCGPCKRGGFAEKTETTQPNQSLNKLSQAWDQASSRILETAVNGINEAHKATLKDFTTSELEQELLKRQDCHFGRLNCTNQAQVYLIKPQQPACFNCQQDVLILSKDK